MTGRNYTNVGGYFICNDCGASSLLRETVRHHPTCQPGESRRWEEYYAELNDDDDAEYEEYLAQGKHDG